MQKLERDQPQVTGSNFWPTVNKETGPQSHDCKESNSANQQERAQKRTLSSRGEHFSLTIS